MTSIYDVVKTLCLGFPETSETISHGFPNYKIRDKSVFATFTVNHHGDNKVALLLNASRESQEMLVTSAPKIFFVPPYVGPKGWVGVELNKGLGWDRLAEITHQAYQRTAPDALAKVSVKPAIKAPTKMMTAEDINPLLSTSNQKILNTLRTFCLSLPEVTEQSQFGDPCFKAGKKSFCTLGHHKGKTWLQFWAGADQQLSLTSFDERFRVPAYVGHNGWLDLDITEKQDWPEIQSLLLDSYKHFALQRMLKALG